MGRVTRPLFLGAVALLGLALLLVNRPSLEAQAPECTSGVLLEQILTGGSRWDLCWSESEQEGILLHDVHFTAPGTPRQKVLKEAGLAQIYIEPMDGGPTSTYVGGVGLGGDHLAELRPADCPDGERLSLGDRAILCKQVSARGYIYKYFQSERQGQYLSLMSASIVDGRVFLVEWRFFDDGTIEPRFGESGAVQRLGNDSDFGWPTGTSGQIAYGHVTHVYWRLDMDIGLHGNDDILEEIELRPEGNDSQRRIDVRRLTEEEARPVNPEIKRSWRLRASSLANSDGHRISYHLEPADVGHSSGEATGAEWTRNQFYATALKSCERTGLLNSSEGECAADLPGYMNGESLVDADPVLWFGLSAAWLPRAEDQPVIPTRWLRFALIPRDWTAVNPLIR